MEPFPSVETSLAVEIFSAFVERRHWVKSLTQDFGAEAMVQFLELI